MVWCGVEYDWLAGWLAVGILQPTTGVCDYLTLPSRRYGDMKDDDTT